MAYTVTGAETVNYSEQKQVVLSIRFDDGICRNGRILGESQDGRAIVMFANEELLNVPFSRIQQDPCSKCNGTGFYCTHMHNGRPQSATGFDCWKCNGSGWAS